MNEKDIRADERKRLLYFVTRLIAANIEDEAKELLPGLQFAYEKLAEANLNDTGLPAAPDTTPQGLYVIEFCARRFLRWRSSATWTIAGSPVEAMQFGVDYAKKQYPLDQGWRWHTAKATQVEPAYVRQAVQAGCGE